MPSAAARFRSLLAGDDVVVAPGAADALTARLIEQAGFPAVHCTGGGVARSLGLSDLGETTLGEVADRVRGMAEVCHLPLVVDVDAGFGGVLNLMRTVRIMEAADAAAIHVEDMAIPHRARRGADNLYPPREAADRVRAALRARTDPAFAVIARTNALPELGLDAAVDRANRYADAGADLVYVEFFENRAQIEEVARRVAAPKLIGAMHDSDDTPLPADLAAMGYRVLIVSAAPQLAAIHGIRALLGHLKRHGTTSGFDALVSFAERDAITGGPEARALEAEFLP